MNRLHQIRCARGRDRERARGGGCGEAAGRSEAITTARTARSSGVDEVVDGQAISVLAAGGVVWSGGC